jgi:hypothetical protein
MKSTTGAPPESSIRQPTVMLFLDVLLTVTATGELGGRTDGGGSTTGGSTTGGSKTGGSTTGGETGVIIAGSDVIPSPTELIDVTVIR